MLKKLLVATTISILLLGMMGLALIPKANAVVSPVTWVNEDTTTKGNWLDPQNSITGTYGSCAHIFPGPGPQENPIEDAISPVTPAYPTDLYGTTYAWTYEQLQGWNFALAHPGVSFVSPYWDEYVNTGPTVISYTVAGTKEPGVDKFGNNIMIQYPVFTWAWTHSFTSVEPNYPNLNGWNSALQDPRPLSYQTTVTRDGVTSITPGYSAVCWDDGGERCQPINGYMNFTLAFPLQGSYVLSLYAYDYENTSRASEMYKIYDSTGTILLASKGISGTTFDNGVYEQFWVTAPAGGLTIILQVYNDAGHVAYTVPYPATNTNNVVLSGIFVENIASTQACGRTKGFWQQNAMKDLGISNGNGIQVQKPAYLTAIDYVNAHYGGSINDWTIAGNPVSPLSLPAWGISVGGDNAMKAGIHWLSYAQVSFPSTIIGGQGGNPNDVQTKARGQMLCLMLTSAWNGFGGVMYNGHTVDYWIGQAITMYNSGNFAGALSLASSLNSDTLCGMVWQAPPV